MSCPLMFIRAAIVPRWFVAKNHVVPPLYSTSLPPSPCTYNFVHCPPTFSPMPQ